MQMRISIESLIESGISQSYLENPKPDEDGGNWMPVYLRFYHSKLIRSNEA